MTGEIILPNSQPETIYIVNDAGKEVQVRFDDLWMYQPDAYNGQATRYNLDDLPETEWRDKGEDE